MTSGAGPGAPRAGAVTPSAVAGDEPEQHPVLRLLGTGQSVGAAVRQGAVWAAGARVLGQVLQFLGTVVTARLLHPTDYGQAAIIFPLTTFAGLVTTLGLGSAVIHARHVTEKLLSTAFWLNALAVLGFTGLLAALAVPLSKLYSEPVLVPLLWLASLTFALNLGVVQVALLERTMRFRQIAFLETACTVAGLTTTIIAAALGAGAFSLVCGPIVYQLSLTIALWRAVPWHPTARPDRRSAHELWSYARGAGGFTFLSYWSRNADNLLLARFVSLADLGNYNRAYNLMRLPVQQMNAMMDRALFPALARLRDDRRRLGAAWTRALSTAAALTAPITLGMAVAAPALIETLFGRRWLGMVTVLELLAAAALPQTLTTTVSGVLRATGATDTLFRLGVINSSLGLAAMIGGLPWGTVGVAAALTAKFYLEVLISVPPCLRETGLGWGDVVRALRGVWLACLALAAAGLSVRVGLGNQLPAWQVLLAQVAAAGLAYGVVLFLTDRRPFQLALSLARRAPNPG